MISIGSVLVNVIVVLLVIVLLGFALKGAIKHFKGEGACCGGGGSSVVIDEKKLEGPVLGSRVVRISGMTCENCVARVTNAINRIDGASAKVNLKKKEAVVSYDRAVEDAAIRKAVENAGYHVESISG
ncbi:MAG: heavy metal-associated domain-containing protein [Eubacteriales bacterium]|nr:heavy metal-associated domain-containing protein [Eubacteriales bacterium]